MSATTLHLSAHLVMTPENWSRRNHRLLVLLAAIVVLSMADLAITLTHLQTIGMIEANPVAAFLIRESGSAWTLALFKSCTVALCVTLLFALRRSRFAEVGAWTAIIVLVGLSIQWHIYTERFVEDPHQLLLVRSGTLADQWLMLD
jgi:uncharacterized membrane protein